ncbi:hypothetical protein KHQ81_07715 [Mycoplasmatota bacterium]|nr:hypothetical protein KHQ81_07715 [Mycoplasmatota bacterium]
MDFKALREQILANIESYNTEEMKIVVIKLLDFLVDINEKRSNLEAENKTLFAEMDHLKKNPLSESPEDYKLKIDEIIAKANEEAQKITDNAREEAENIILEANKNSQLIIDKADDSQNKIIQSFIEKMQQVIEEIKLKDDEAKLYRKHILSIFRKTLFRFSDTNYYIIRSDNEEFRDLLQFFEVDEKLQKLCDENIEKLSNDPKYQEIVQMVKENPSEEDIVGINNILKDEHITIDNKTIELKEVEPTDIEDIIIEEQIDEIVEDEEEKLPQGKSKFLDIINQYKNNK